MNWVAGKIKWIMLLSGVLTCTMLYAAIAPQDALQSTFGDTLQGPLAEIVVRNWGALIGLIGAMLIYGAFDPLGRPFILLVAGTSKIIFIALVLAYGRQYLGGQLAVSVVVDAVMVLLFATALAGTRRVQAAA
jgi:hypothetical protein